MRLEEALEKGEIKNKFDKTPIKWLYEGLYDLKALCLQARSNKLINDMKSYTLHNDTKSMPRIFSRFYYIQHRTIAFSVEKDLHFTDYKKTRNSWSTNDFAK